MIHGNLESAAKVTTLGVLVWFSVMLTYRYILQSFPAGKSEYHLLTSGEALTFLPCLIALGYAILRFSTMAFWKNALLTIFQTTLIAFITGFFWRF